MCFPFVCGLQRTKKILSNKGFCCCCNFGGLRLKTCQFFHISDTYIRTYIHTQKRIVLNLNLNGILVRSRKKKSSHTTWFHFRFKIYWTRSKITHHDENAFSRGKLQWENIIKLCTRQLIGQLLTATLQFSKPPFFFPLHLQVFTLVRWQFFFLSLPLFHPL